jgi:hypothetical protein
MLILPTNAVKTTLPFFKLINTSFTEYSAKEESIYKKKRPALAKLFNSLQCSLPGLSFYNVIMHAQVNTSASDSWSKPNLLNSARHKGFYVT